MWRGFAAACLLLVACGARAMSLAPGRETRARASGTGTLRRRPPPLAETSARARNARVAAFVRGRRWSEALSEAREGLKDESLSYKAARDALFCEYKSMCVRVCKGCGLH